MAEVYFPANVENMEHSQDYTELKKRIVELDAKLDRWLSGFDKRLSAAEFRKPEATGKAPQPQRRLPRKKPDFLEHRSVPRKLGS